jgi:CRISPR-associated protein Csb2
MATVILQQHFPLGRFHANPWKAFPFDDPYGEWPPSPWRLVRALIARSHQLAREEPDIAESDRADLVRAFCTSSIRWHLPVQSWRGPGLRQYQPAEFSRVPKSATEPGYMAHATTKNLDNCWLIGGADDAVWWFIEGPDENWNPSVLRLLDSCLARMTYFGRAESITLMKRSTGEMKHLELNCSTTQWRTSRSVPVLFPASEGDSRRR